MPIFHIIHNLDWGKNLTNGQRNCRTFLCGICIYVAIYIIMKNLQIYGYLNQIFDVLYSGLIIIFVADIAVMAYTYRSYFGRNILHELSPDTKKKDDWYYDEKTHKYSNHLPLEEQLARNLQEQKAQEEYQLHSELLKEQIEREKERIEQEKERTRQAIIIAEETDKIVDNKNRLRATVKIQRWWRKHLYKAESGVLYLKAQRHFNNISTAT